MATWTSGYVSEISYTQGFYRELTPAVLGFVALSKGVSARKAEAPLAYCELGCGQGFSANVLAAANPHVSFHATDFNPTHVAGARALAAAAGSSNIRFYDDAFADFLARDDLPDFDIVSLHGIWSWISAENRRVIVEFIRRRLKVGGLVYLSYNALPGWASGMPLRRLLVDHAAVATGSIEKRIDAALAFSERIRSANSVYFRVNPGVGERLDRMKASSRNYLAHEHLNRDWEPFYHADVAAELDEAKLSFVGSTALLDHVDAVSLTQEHRDVLADVPAPALRETVRDFLVNQQFRRDVFQKGPIALNALDLQDAWADQRFALSIRREDAVMHVDGAGGRMGLIAEVYAPILDAFASGPRTIRQIAADAAIAGLGWARLRQAITVLVGTDQLQPCLGEAGESARAERTRAFNRAVVLRARASADLGCLASPVTGSGVAVDRFGQLFILAEIEGEADPAQFAASILEAQGQRVVKDGRRLENPAEHLAEFRAQYEAFQTRRRPVLTALGVV
ncbi:class I SAM-dependent methyltransferase [Chthonobacter rhizosphaerae]|uniref:class I SAM-dependent methyltransferase n=1 Tax=Chthonobacter rhizosphaerae TaxID=2735553 RepID=UPI0015EE8EF2|nr:class I SAM-dependent methyltransferase [Chthonobacter rhizosphaerae]